MQTTESCKYCEKILVSIETDDSAGQLLELPSTYDPGLGAYVWKRADIMSYAIIPRTASGKTARLDFYICMDEEDEDDVNLLAYAEKVLRRCISYGAQSVKKISFVQPILSPPVDLECCKLKHGGVD